jgi:hypothetical protein
VKVKCVVLLDEHTGANLQTSPWLTIGKEYLVLGIYLPFAGTLMFRLLGDDGATPALHDASQFEVISGFLPSEWKVEMVPRKYLSLEPEPWLAPGFWDAYFNLDPDAKAVFDRSFKRMVEEQVSAT